MVTITTVVDRRADRVRMTTLQEAQAVFNQLEPRVRNHPAFSGIEIAALEKDGVHTDEPCVRVLVNSVQVTHATLGIPKEMQGVQIQVQFRIIEPH
jgi:hypothetical protein